MEPADSIRRLGFARWYERSLIEGHVWLITVLFCLIAIAACMEELSFVDRSRGCSPTSPSS